MMLPPPPANKTGWPWTTEISTPPNNRQSWPKVTIVTPSYAQGQYLEETIRSVLMQGYPDLEYIVLDGGSADHSVDILRKYSPYLAYWASEPDNGQADAINKGFARSTGDIMGWLNSDDILLPNAVFHIVEAFEKNASIEICCGFRKIINETGHQIAYWGALPTTASMKYECNVAQETVYWRRKVWQEIGPLNSEFHYALDYEYWQRALNAGYRFTLLPYFLGSFRIHTLSKGTQLKETRENEMRRIYSHYLGQDLSSQQAIDELGPLWTLKRLLVKDLWHFPLFVTHLRVTVALLKLLEIGPIAYPLLLGYRFYRALRRR